MIKIIKSNKNFLVLICFIMVQTIIRADHNSSISSIVKETDSKVELFDIGRSLLNALLANMM